MSSAVVLVGHGSVAKDMPRSLIQRFRALEQQRRSNGTPPSSEQLDLEQQIRRWPRTPSTDPYKAGMDAIAERLRLRVGNVVVAFNEFCAPSLEEAVQSLIGQGISQITVATTMLTPGGTHSEIDIPQAISALQAQHPATQIRYAWPVDLDAVARLLEEVCLPNQ